MMCYILQPTGRIIILGRRIKNTEFMLNYFLLFKPNLTVRQQVITRTNIDKVS